MLRYICIFCILFSSSYSDSYFSERSGNNENFPAIERHPLHISNKMNNKEDFSMQGHADIKVQSYIKRPQNKHKNNVTFSERIKIKYKKNNFSTHINLYAQQDIWDLSKDDDKNERTFARLDEAYMKYSFDNSTFMLGKSIRFWGALELRNIVDVFNPQDIRNDPFTTDKLGVWNAAYTYYTDNGEVSFIIKTAEQDRALSAFPYVYYYFDESLKYDKNLHTEESSFRPNVYLKWSGSTETEYALDYAFIIQDGYDSQRYIKLNSSTLSLKENAYLVKKFMTYDTLVLGSTLIKFEALYADVKNDKEISDYYQVGLGVEYTLNQIYGDENLGLLAEYYCYGVLDKDKRNDLALFEVFQNDLFLGVRYTFNEGNDASIVVGVVIDLDYDEEAYYIEYESRVYEKFKINIDYRYLNASKDDLTVYHLLREHQRFNVTLGYYF